MVDLLAFLLTAFHPEVVNPLLQRNGTVRIEKKKKSVLTNTITHVAYEKSHHPVYKHCRISAGGNFLKQPFLYISSDSISLRGGCPR